MVTPSWPKRASGCDLPHRREWSFGAAPQDSADGPEIRARHSICVSKTLTSPPPPTPPPPPPPPPPARAGGGGGGGGGGGHPPVEPEPSSHAEFTPTDSAEEP